jgi:hypothetical protein
MLIPGQLGGAENFRVGKRISTFIYQQKAKPTRDKEEK